MEEIRINITLRKSLLFIIMGCMLTLLSFTPATYGENLTVNGDVSGVWGWIDDGEDLVDTVFVEGTITIPSDETLRINPNVRILFIGNFRFLVEGLLSAVNDAEGGQDIEFAGLNGADWRGIWFRQGDRGNSLLTGCIISDAWVGIDINDTSPSIFKNTLSALSVGINCQVTSSYIAENEIFVGDPSSSIDLTGIALANEANVLIESNKIIVNSDFNGTFMGIKVIDSHPVIQENFIDVETIGIGYGVYSADVIKLDLIRNVIRTRSSNQLMGAFFSHSTGVLLLNNTFHLLGNAADSWGLKIEQGSRLLIISNIIIGNNYSNGIESEDGTVVISSGYNNIWNHGRPFIGEWQGGGTDIFENPLIMNASADADSRDDYILILEVDGDGNRVLVSPCIDTGSPQFHDPDGTRSDMGAMPFDQSVLTVANPIDLNGTKLPTIFRMIEVYPNPFNSSTHIQFSLDNPTAVAIDIFDHTGRSIEQLWDGSLRKGTHNFTWKPTNLSSGSYFIKLKSERVDIMTKTSYLR